MVIFLGFMTGTNALTRTDIWLAQNLALQIGASSEAIITIMQGISWIGGGISRYIVVVLLAIILWRKIDVRTGVSYVVMVVATNLSSDLLKAFFARPRPDFVPHLDGVSSFAYPSGHASCAAAICLGFIFFMNGKLPSIWAKIFIFAAFIMGMSRIMLGVHWPTDILGGWLLGSAFAFLGYALVRFLGIKST
ncbi:phosphatase PAP2 family protein [Sphingorhabdus lutea]|nr:phosphatase PAP2 family protein [Sphingorhabdus lutea]